MVDEITLSNLLHHISHNHENLCWELNTRFSDGIDVTLMEITFYEFLPRRKKGQICFQLETGEVKNLRYPGMQATDLPRHIYEALRDVKTLERR